MYWFIGITKSSHWNLNFVAWFFELDNRMELDSCKVWHVISTVLTRPVIFCWNLWRSAVSFLITFWVLLSFLDWLCFNCVTNAFNLSIVCCWLVRLGFLTFLFVFFLVNFKASASFCFSNWIDFFIAIGSRFRSLLLTGPWDGHGHAGPRGGASRLIISGGLQPFWVLLSFLDWLCFNCVQGW